jgi:ABC-type nitrate/sulfonate/bicarbonate transport system ATPase subunit
VLEFARTGDVLLDVHNVSLSFGDKLVLRDVHAHISNIARPDQVQGQVICFLGPSGIGKTQLSRIIAGLQKPTVGRVMLPSGQAYDAEGKRVSRSDPGAHLVSDVETYKGKVGMVPQNYWMPEYLTVAAHLALAGGQGGLTPPQIKEKAEMFTALFGLGDYLKSFPKELSGGTRQRVAIARQMMCAGHYLVMDEPFSGLDPIMKAKASEAITTLASLDELNTVIIVTHDISEGMAIADTVWLMGYEPNDRGGFLPGARIVEQYDLAAKGLCWRADIQSDPDFLELVGAVKARFQTLR